MNDSLPPSSPSSQQRLPDNFRHPSPPYQIEDEGVSVLDFLRMLAKFKAVIISITLFVTIAAVAVAFLMTPIYRAEVLLAPVSDEQQSSMSAIASQFGGLASLAGINLGSSASNTDQVIATLRSRSFIGNFIAERHLMQVLFADKWDATNKTWNVSSQDDVPTALDAYKLFDDDILNVTTDKKTGIITLAVE